jgi:hypothetical protein
MAGLSHFRGDYAEAVTEVLEWDHEHIEEEKKAAAMLAAKEEAHPWEGEGYDFTVEQRRLLEKLWTEPEHAVDEKVVWKAVYGEKTFSSDALRQLEQRTRNKLEQYQLPLTIKRPRRSKSIRLVHL